MGSTNIEVVMSDTPIRDAYEERKRLIVLKNEEGDRVDIKTGDAILGQNKTQGIVKKVGRVNVIIESPYGGYNGSDIMLLELKIKRSDIVRHLKG